MKPTKQQIDARLQQIEKLCEKAGCNDKKREIHREQFLRRWNPHPTQGFADWWKTHADSSWLDVVRAYNDMNYRSEYLEAKQFGVAT